MMLQLDPPIPVITPKGSALAHIIIDYGAEHHLFWVCFQDEGGECWTWPNYEIRAQNNITMGRNLWKPEVSSSADSSFSAGLQSDS